MKPRVSSIALSCLLTFAATPAAADSTLSGVCPDGSFFIVQSRANVPCSQPRFVEAGDMPPLRPHLLPRPYAWYVDQEARNANNPYNLVDAAEKIRAARLGPKPGSTPEAEAQQAARAGSAPAANVAARPLPTTPEPHASPSGPLMQLADDELRDLVRLIGLRQTDSPAQLSISDARGDARLRIQLAYSASFESFALASLGSDVSTNHVIVFAALAEEDTDFQPNFFVVQNGRTFRPDPTSASELGFLLGQAGKLPSGELAVGYVVVPASFDPQASMELFWNDRSVETVLAPATGGAAPSR